MAEYATAFALVLPAISNAVGAGDAAGNTAQWNKPGSSSSTTRLKSVAVISVALGNPETKVGGCRPRWLPIGASPRFECWE